MEKGQSFSVNGAETTEYPHATTITKKNSDLYFMSHVNINSKWTINQDIRVKTIKFLEENHRRKIS